MRADDNILDDQASLDRQLGCVLDLPLSGKDGMVKRKGLRRPARKQTNRSPRNDVQILSVQRSVASCDTSDLTAVEHVDRHAQAGRAFKPMTSRGLDRGCQPAYSIGVVDRVVAAYVAEGGPAEGPSVKAKSDGNAYVQDDAAIAKTFRRQMSEEMEYHMIGSTADVVEEAHTELYHRERNLSHSPSAASNLSNSFENRHSDANATTLNGSSYESTGKGVEKIEANVDIASDLRGKSPRSNDVVRPIRLVDRLRRHGQRPEVGQHSQKGHGALDHSKEFSLRMLDMVCYGGKPHTSSHSLIKSEEVAQMKAMPREKHNKPKVTYASQRSYLEDKGTGLHPSMAAVPRSPVKTKRALHIASLPLSDSDHVFDQDFHDDTYNQISALRTVHELRKAGNASRLSNEIETLLEEVMEGSISEKRSKLANFVAKFKDSSFRDIFMRKGLYSVIFESLVPQEDTILNLLLVLAASYVLQEAIPNHCLQLISNEAFISMLVSLLDLRDPLGSSVRFRQSNISQADQNDFHRLFDDISAKMVWSFEAPNVVTGRILSLQSLEHIVCRKAQQGAVSLLLPETATCSLWDIIQDLQSSTNMQDNEPREVQLSLSILSRCRVVVGARVEENPWVLRGASTITTLLENRDQLLLDYGDRTSILALTLGLDLTQNGSIVSGRIATPAVIHSCAAFIVGTLSHKLEYRGSSSPLLDQIILNLGLLINLVEFCVPARRHFLRHAKDDVPVLDELLRIFRDGSKDAGEVSDPCFVRTDPMR